jgi:alkylation response protein AidB-like acyl-CoA dehydrogenase
MPLAITDEHRQLAVVARDLVERHGILRQAHDLLDSPEEALGDLWKALAERGFQGLHIPEVYGGQGYGLPELAVVVEELGRAVCPRPFLPSCIAAAVITEVGSAELAERWLPSLADGSAVGAFGFAASRSAPRALSQVASDTDSSGWEDRRSACQRTPNLLSW